MKATRIKGYAELDETIICYWRTEGGTWLLYYPRCGIGNLKNHTVVENPDNTITVTPSILITAHNEGKATTIHGYITNGEWKEC